MFDSALRGYAGYIPDNHVEAVKNDDRVSYVFQDQTVSVSSSPRIYRSVQILPTGVDRVDGDLSSAKSGDGSGIVDADVAVIDSGVDIQHQDLTVEGGIDCVGGKRNFDDENGHGTHVAGIIGAHDDRNGIVGVAPLREIMGGKGVSADRAVRHSA